MNLQLFYIYLLYPSTRILLSLAATRSSVRDVTVPKERDLPYWELNLPQDPSIYDGPVIDGITDDVHKVYKRSRGRGDSQCYSPSVSNGYVSPSSWSYSRGDTITYYCNTGYRLVGSNTRTCANYGRWMGTSPSCQIITCGDPGMVANSQRTLSDDFNYNSYARYTCNTGYGLQGSAILRCEESGRWSAPLPTCQPIICPAPPALPNGSVQTPDGHIYDADAIYSCNAGFYLRGVATRTCQTNGQWGGDMPTCEVILCPTLPHPSHSIVSYSRQMSYGSVASYSCDPGYRLTGGNAARTCGGSGPTGTWSGAAPTCNIVSCPDPGNPDHGVKLGSTYTYGSAVSYQCLAGYTISGAARIECQASQQWTADLPSCNACPLNTYKAGSNVDACSTCPAHTHTVRTASVARTQCLCDEEYRGPNGGPCEFIVCPDIPLPAHAVQVSCNKYFRGQCVFDCVDGHVRTGGDDVRVCEYESVWSGYDIVCSACPKDTYKSTSGSCLGCPPYSHTEDTGNEIEDCVCDTGFERLGEPDTQCTDIDECADDNGGCDQTCKNTVGNHTCLCTDPGFIKDAENPENCIPKNDCPPLQAPDNGGFVCVGQPRTNTERCQVKCNDGYEHVLEPSYYEECGPTSNWQWSHTLRNVPIMPCEQAFFEGFQMEAEVFYFVSSCDSLTDAQIIAAKQEFLAYLFSQNLCSTSGMMQCSMSDVTLECGDVTFKRRKRSTNFRLKFKFTVAIPAVPRSEVDCNDYCVRQSYCEERCADNYKATAESELVAASNVIQEIFDGSNTHLFMAPISIGFGLQPEEDTALMFGGILMTLERVQVKNVSAFCDMGFASSNDKCVPCPAGSFLGHSECQPCPEGTYQPEGQALACRPCATATEKGMDNCPPGINPFDIIIDAAIDVAYELEEASEGVS